MTIDRSGRAESPAGVPAAGPVPKLLNRESAILDFSRRVLAQARRADVPLLERLRYITIVSSNLDEFFEVRFADYLEASRLPNTTVTRSDVQTVSAAAHALIDDQYRVFNEEVVPALQSRGLTVLSHAERDAAQREWVARFFEQQVRPLLMPVGLDPSHPFPTVANKSLNFICRLEGRDAFGRENLIAIIKVPRALPRVIRLPEALSGGKQAYVLLTSVIRAHLGEMFPGRRAESFSQFRVTRDSDLDVDEDEVTNLRQALRTGLSTRHYGQAIRLEVVATCPTELSQFLLTQFGLPDDALYRVNGPVNLGRLTQLIDQAVADELRFPPFVPAWPKWRVVSPVRSAWRKLVTSSSSTSRSESRVTRNCENDSTVRPGKSSSRWARITLVSSTKPCRPPHSGAGRRITRDRMRGTFTIAIWFSRPNASRPPRRTMKLSDLFATSGNGCDGSRLTGTSSGRTCSSKKPCTQRRCAASRSAWLMTTMPSRCSAGMTSSLKSAYCSSMIACAAAATDARSWFDTPVPGARAASM
jgi:hypothetical protein